MSTLPLPHNPAPSDTDHGRCDLLEQVVAATERLCRLCLAPSQEWLEKAAAAMVLSPHAAGVALLLCDVNRRGIITSVHAAGAWPIHASFPAPLGTTVINSVQAINSAHDMRMHLSALAGHHWLGAGAHDRPKGIASNAPALVDQECLPHRAAWTLFGGRCVLGARNALSPGSQRCLLSYISLRSAERSLVELHRCWNAVSSLASRLALRTFSAAEPFSTENWLSTRELEVLDLLLAGHSVPAISDAQRRSVHTVHDYVKRLHAKLCARSRGELVARVLGHTLSASTPRPPAPTESEALRFGPYG